MAAEKQVTYYRYVVPAVKHEGWGEFVVSSNGFFAAVTDYGNYAYCWRNTGEQDFRRFVVGLEPGYLLRKVGHRETDVEATVNNFKEDICRQRRGRYRGYTKEDARDAWDDLDRVTTEHELMTWYSDNSTSIADSCESFRQRYSLEDQNFAEKLLPRLQELIRADLKNGDLPLLKVQRIRSAHPS